MTSRQPEITRLHAALEREIDSLTSVPPEVKLLFKSAVLKVMARFILARREHEK